MRYGYIMVGGDAGTAAELAPIAEEHGWDGFFCWDGIWTVDVWVMLAAAAMRTQRIRLGTMLTPLPRKRPWDLAAQSATVDRLSSGRVTLAVGLGVTGEDRWWLFEDDPGRKARAEMLDEGLEMLERLWTAEPFEYAGRHYRARRLDPLMPPAPAAVQRPRIPIWAVGAWPRTTSMRRAARLDGLVPAYLPRPGNSGSQDRDGFTPELLAEAVSWVRRQRADNGLTGAYDVVMEGVTPGDDPRAAADTVRPWADAGATWWLEADWSVSAYDLIPTATRRLAAGPPRID